MQNHEVWDSNGKNRHCCSFWGAYCTNHCTSRLFHFHLIFRVNASMCTGQRHISIAEHLAKYTSKPKFLSRLNMEQTLVEGENYDAYVSGPLIAPLFFTKKLVGSSRSYFPVDHFGTLYCAVHLHMWKRWFISKSQLKASFAFSFYYRSLTTVFLRNILTIWGTWDDLLFTAEAWRGSCRFPSSCGSSDVDAFVQVCCTWCILRFELSAYKIDYVVHWSFLQRNHLIIAAVAFMVQERTLA